MPQSPEQNLMPHDEAGEATKIQEIVKTGESHNKDEEIAIEEEKEKEIEHENSEKVISGRRPSIEFDFRTDKEITDLQKTIEKNCSQKVERLTELTKLPIGKRFFHHSVMKGIDEVDIHKLANLLNNGIYDRGSHSDELGDSSDWTYKGGVSVFPDSRNSYHNYGEDPPIITILIDPENINNRATKADDLYALKGETTISGDIEPENILGISMCGMYARYVKEYFKWSEEGKQKSYKILIEKAKKLSAKKVKRELGGDELMTSDLIYMMLLNFEQNPDRAVPIFESSNIGHNYEARYGLQSKKQIYPVVEDVDGSEKFYKT
ncbi:MAG: hypothetical protein Q7T49_00355 [bacterium]|nr:hypothetical protein [bacterium]